MNIRNLALPLVFSALTIAAHAQTAETPEKPIAPGIQPANMDTSVKPGWIKRTVIPPDRGGAGVFMTLYDESTKNTRAIIDETAKSNPAPGTDARKIADLYNSYMDEAAIESRGLAPIRPQLAAIAAIKDKKQLARALGQSLRADVDALNNTNFHTPNLFGLWVAPGFQDSDHYAAYLLQGGLVLPDREYYLGDNEHMKAIREKYKAHISTMLKLAGFSDTDARAAKILALEHDIAEKQTSLAENEDIHKANNTWKQADFTAKAPGLDWEQYFAGAGLSHQAEFTVWQPSAFTGEAALVASTPLDTWKDWLAFHALEDGGSFLPKALADEDFDFYGKMLYGVPQQRPRWRRAVSVVNGELGDAVGQIYAQRYFSPQAKAEAQAMVANIIAAFRKRIDSLDWMAPATKAEAQAKLTTLYVGVGYPETWQDYSAYEVKADDLYGNIERAEMFRLHYGINRIGKAVDKHQWSMTPQTVNAVNLPLQNALNFPAAILQPPFFDAKAPAPSNYGAIGTVIGHEISHTFDTEGSAFDSKGRVRNWWTEADLKHFNAATAKLAAQFDAYQPFPDIHVNGKQTIAENIADNGGLTAAFDAYHVALNGQPAPEQYGFTGDQQFFIAFGQNWGTKDREAGLRQQVLTDPHAPDEYRADEVRNVDAWYKAFNVQPGEKLYLAPAERVRIW